MVSGQRLPVRLHSTACVRFGQSWLYDHLAEHNPILKQSESLVRLWQRQFAIDDRLELARADEVQERGQILAHPTIGAEDIELKRPDVAQILFGIETGGSPAGQKPSLPVQRS